MIRTGVEVVHDGVDTILQSMGVGERRLELDLGESLVDRIGKPVCSKGIELVLDAVMIAVVSGGDGHRVAFAEYAVPAHRPVYIAVAECRVIAEAELVARPVAVEMEAVAAAYLLAQAQIDVLERGLSARISAPLWKQIEYPVGIGRTAAQDECGAVLHYGAFQMQAAGEQAEAERSLDFLAVALAVAYLQHGGDASAV